MAGKKGSETRAATKRPRLKYFFLNDQIHLSLHINRGKDTISAWNYPEHARKVYSYSWVLRTMKPAYPTSKVAELLNRSVRSIQLYMEAGAIRTPQHTYALHEPQKIAKYMWREEDIMELHEYLAGIHVGRPRNDGETTNNSIPTPRELRALLNEEAILYVKQGDKYVPSWKAKEI
jgi:hypothetical protein